MINPEFSRFYGDNYARLVRQIRPICQSMADAEDCVQDAFAKALLKWPRIREYDNPVAWTRLAAVNVALSHLRRQKVAINALGEISLGMTDEDDPADRIVGRQALLQAMNKLPRQQQLAIAMFHLADLSVTDIADSTGHTEVNVRTHLSRGRRRLAAIMMESSQ